MAELDFVVPGITVSQSDTVIDTKALYRLIKDWFAFHKYDLLEKEHTKDENRAHTLIKWEGERKADDYVKYVIKVTFTLNNEKQVTVKEKGRELKRHRVTIKVYIESYLEKDYEDRWEKTPIQQFFRAVYDKFMITGRLDRYADELRKHTLHLRDEIKSYLRIQKL